MEALLARFLATGSADDLAALLRQLICRACASATGAEGTGPPGPPGPPGGTSLAAGALLGVDPVTSKLVYESGTGIVSLAQGSVSGMPSWILETVPVTSPRPAGAIQMSSAPASPLIWFYNQVDATHYEVWLFNTTSNAVEDPFLVFGPNDFVSFDIFQGGSQAGTAPLEDFPMARTVTYEQFGARGNGIDDDQAAIQAAHNAAGAGGRIECSPSATYRPIAGNIAPLPGQVVIGRYTKFLRSSAEADTPVFRAPDANVNPVIDVTLERCVVVGDYGTNPLIPSTSRCLAQVGDRNVLTSGPSGWKILECKANGVNGPGVFAFFNQDGSERGTSVTGCVVENCYSGYLGGFLGGFLKVTDLTVFNCVKGFVNGGGNYVKGGLASGNYRNIEVTRSNTVFHFTGTTSFGGINENIFLGPGPTTVAGPDGPLHLGGFFEGCKIEFGLFDLEGGCRAIHVTGGSIDCPTNLPLPTPHSESAIRMTKDPGSGDPGWVKFHGVWFPVQAGPAPINLIGDVDFTNPEVIQFLDCDIGTAQRSDIFPVASPGLALFDPNQPLATGSNLIGWWRGDVGLSPATWFTSDTSGTSLGNFVQPILADEPAITTVNTLAAPQSSGAPIEMHTLVALPATFTIFLLTRIDAPTGALDSVWSIGASPLDGGTVRYTFQARGGGNWTLLDEGVAYLDTGVPVVVGDLIIWCFTITNGSQQIYRYSGSSLQLLASGAEPTGPLNPMFIFSGFNGHAPSTIPEILVYDGILSVEEITNIAGAYLKPKWHTT
jgi:hypothetical protein